MRLAAVCAIALMMAACGDGSATASPPVPGSAAVTDAQSAPTPRLASVSREFSNWRATCDNGNACVAYTGVDDGGWLRVALDPGPQATSSVMVGKWFNEGDAPTGPVVLTIDGQRHATTVGPEDSGSYAIPAADVGAVLTELARATRITLSSGSEAQDLSPAGASASLLWIDERQGRLETATALLRHGDRPASSVPAAPALPRLVPAAAISQAGFEGGATASGENDPTLRLPATLEALPAIKQCRDETAFNAYVQKAVMGARLDARTELWGIPCDSGAYNVMYQFYLTGLGGVNPRHIDFPDADGRIAAPTEGDTDALVNPSYDPATRTLSAFAKARGIGDCGTAQTWVWTGQAFVMSREQVMGECWGMVSDFWPTTLRSQ